MKTATILPQKFLHLVKDDDYHMALAHLIGKEGFEQYTEFFKAVGEDPNKFLMLDTGLIEGDPRPTEELLEKAKMLGADEMALPDVFMDHQATLRQSYEAMEYVQNDYARHGNNDKSRYPNLMAIPQGTCHEDWVACAKEMLTWPVQTIGIPKVLYKLEGMRGRLDALTAIQDALGDKEVHLLGCWETPLELKMIENATRAGHIKPVRGVDSAIAYAFAKEGLRITDAERPQDPINFGAQEVDMDVLKYNIKVWKEEAATLPPIDDAKNQKIRKLY